MDKKLQKNSTNSLKEKSQYGLTFGVIAMMLFVAGFPMIVIAFFGVFAYFLWKTFSHTPRSGVREIFEFYLSANEVLRDDERKWFGFEVHEIINRGERILQAMHGAPPLVYFALGALYHKVENFESAVHHLSYVVEEDLAKESSYLHPSGALRNYVRVLRKIEREPTEAPQTSAAIRALERVRKNRGERLLAESRDQLAKSASLENSEKKEIFSGLKKVIETGKTEERLLKTVNETPEDRFERERSYNSGAQSVRRKKRRKNGRSANGRHEPDFQNEEDLFRDRKPITEVLHDIYDKNIQ